VYSSYLGRQWHQLWLMTSEGGDPFQLTYGEGDATAPRWSPDGRRIAFISNENGNTELQILDVPGGAVQRIVAEKRIYREPVGRLRLAVVDAAGRPMPARVSIAASDGRSFAPDDAWHHADDGSSEGSNTGISTRGAPRSLRLRPARSRWRFPGAPNTGWFVEP
jgi:dipeptidyl aminopeptidase/acylaminoacyl peptidase